MVKQSGVPMFFKVFMIIFIILAVGLPTAYLTNKHVKQNVDKLLGKSNENKLVKKCEEKFGKNHDYEKSLEAFYRLPDHISMKYETVDLSKEYDQEIYDRGFETWCQHSLRRIAGIGLYPDHINDPLTIKGKTCKEWDEAEINYSGEPEREFATNSYIKGVVDACALFGQ